MPSAGAFLYWADAEDANTGVENYGYRYTMSEF